MWKSVFFHQVPNQVSHDPLACTEFVSRFFSITKHQNYFRGLFLNTVLTCFFLHSVQYFSPFQDLNFFHGNVVGWGLRVCSPSTKSPIVSPQSIPSDPFLKLHSPFYIPNLLTSFFFAARRCRGVRVPSFVLITLTVLIPPLGADPDTDLQGRIRHPGALQPESGGEGGGGALNQLVIFFGKLLTASEVFSIHNKI